MGWENIQYNKPIGSGHVNEMASKLICSRAFQTSKNKNKNKNKGNSNKKGWGESIKGLGKRKRNMKWTYEKAGEKVKKVEVKVFKRLRKKEKKDEVNFFKAKNS
jgi:uncharacterized protein (DUF427 family)